jgi:hypothetical protein
MFKVVSGGQTGVDRAALDVAMFLGLEHGGWCPKGRLAEDGIIPNEYQLKETTSSEYSVRTEQNVIDSDATLILFRNTVSGGTLLTKKYTAKHRRPSLMIDLENECEQTEFKNWISEFNICVLNVAGPRASSDPLIYDLARQCLLIFFEPFIVGDEQ